jgi:hypothetical protein
VDGRRNSQSGFRADSSAAGTVALESSSATVEGCAGPWELTALLMTALSSKDSLAESTPAVGTLEAAGEGEDSARDDDAISPDSSWCRCFRCCSFTAMLEERTYDDVWDSTATGATVGKE